MAANDEAVAIGIDLGNNSCCMGYWVKDRVEVIPNDLGNRTTPSFVAFTESERLIGEAAKNQVAMNPQNTVFDAMRLIGRRFNDSVVQSDMKHWPFKLIDRDGKPAFQVKYKGETKVLTPEEVCSMILYKLKTDAESHLGKKVDKAVISIPTYFNDSQRQSIKDAAEIAGIKALYVITNATSAAITYGLEKNKTKGEKIVLIFDLGGGTLDVSLLTVDEGICEVKAVAGDTHLGGEDFDSRMVNHFVDEFKSKHKKDLSSNARALRRLRTACERAKRTLSSENQASLEIDALLEGIDFYTSITRSRFEELNVDLFRGTLDPIERVLKDSKIDKGQVDEIVLVGGSTRIPKVRKLVQDFFNGKEPNKSVNPDEAVAHGAAIYAAILTGDTSEKTKDILLLDVIPLSVGIETAGGVMTPLVKRNTTLPCKKSENFATSKKPPPPSSTTEDETVPLPVLDFNQNKHLIIRVFEGDRARTKDNNFLGQLELAGVTVDDLIEVKFDIDVKQILDVTVTNKTNKTATMSPITNDKNRLSKEDIGRMKTEAEKYRQDDQRARERIKAKNDLESYAVTLSDTLKDEKVKNKIDAKDRDSLSKAIANTLSWLDQNYEASKDQFDQKQKELKTLAVAVMTKPQTNKPDIQPKPTAPEKKKQEAPTVNPPSFSQSKQPSLDTSNVAKWTVDDVCEYLKQAEIDDEIIAIFRKENIKGKALAKHANEEMLKKIGIKRSGDQVEVIDAINKLSFSTSSANTGVKVPDIPRRELTKDTRLSEGKFGIVWRGTYNGIPVAIKEPKLYGADLIPSQQRADLVEEATVMTSISNNPNVLHCYGISRVGEDDFLLVTELCNLGSLESFLKSYPGTPAVDRRRFSQQVARGLNHLGKHNVAHRDVAARNVLLHDQGGAVIVAKVCDFGLSRQRGEYYMVTGQHLLSPETAPEVLTTGKHSSRSDVWSFGVLLWEVESLCAARARPDTQSFPPLSKPAQASDNMYAIMLKCWAKDPHQRPSFEALIDLLA